MIVKSISISTNMIKNIIVQPADRMSVITEYFDFNCIPYQTIDFWSYDQDKDGMYCIPSDLVDSTDNLLILSHKVFQSFFDCNIGKQQLIKFSKNNYIWIWSDADGICWSRQFVIPLINNAVDIQKDNITIFVDGKFTNPYNHSHLNIQVFPTNKFLIMPRVKAGIINKLNCKYDFLITTIIKPERPHRDILATEITNRSIYSNGLVSMHKVQDSELQDYNCDVKPHWIGDKPTQHDCYEMFPSMDLYRQCWFEIAPETVCEELFFYTEKTNKSIATKTPLLTVSSKGYLEYIRSLGFKTFGSLINESYDQQDTIEDRVRLMLDQAEDIISNGSEQFYHAARPILDYNYNHLAEIAGKYDHLMDAFITQQLERIGFKL